MQGSLKSASRCIKFHTASWVINCVSQWAHLTTRPWVNTGAKSTSPGLDLLKWGLWGCMTKSPVEFAWKSRSQLIRVEAGGAWEWDGCQRNASQGFPKVKGWGLPQSVNSLDKIQQTWEADPGCSHSESFQTLHSRAWGDWAALFWYFWH